MFRQIRIKISYHTGGKPQTFYCQESMENEDVRLEVNHTGGEHLKISLTPKNPVCMQEFAVRWPYQYHEESQIFLNGYQSWTDSREKEKEERMHRIPGWARLPASRFHLQQYGEGSFYRTSRKKGRMHGFTYGYVRKENTYDLFGSLSEREGYTILESDTRRNTMGFRKECAGVWIRAEWKAASLIWKHGSEDAVFDSYFEQMKIEPPTAVPAVGWTSWYHYYQNINEEVILKNLRNYGQNVREITFFQIDDGYQTAVGDWLSVDAQKFPHGMKYLADQIHSEGIRPGIWLAPFVCEKTSRIYREHPDWLLHDDKGNPVMTGWNWSGSYALDFYHPAVQSYLQEVFHTVLEVWGYELVKLDFLYAACLLPREDKTRGQIMAEAMDFLRECVGDKLILGCGVPLGSAFGMVDYCRIGCDISLDWNDKWFMHSLHRERVSTSNAIWNTIGRSHLDGRAFLNDPDVFLLRKENLKLSDSQKELLARVNQLFGSLLFTSDDIETYDLEQWEIYDRTTNLQKPRILDKHLDQGCICILYEDQGKLFSLLVNMTKKKQNIEKYGDFHQIEACSFTNFSVEA